MVVVVCLFSCCLIFLVLVIIFFMLFVCCNLFICLIVIKKIKFMNIVIIFEIFDLDFLFNLILRDNYIGRVLIEIFFYIIFYIN